MMNSNRSSRTSEKTRKLAVVGILVAISLMLSYTPIGYLQIGPFAVTTLHIPVIIGAVVEGPIVGSILGLFFGLTSMFRAFTMPTPTSIIFMNPIVALVPRVLIGLGSYYCYSALKKLIKNNYVTGFVTGIVGTLINTVFVLGLAYMLFVDKFMEIFGGGATSAIVAIGTITLTNGVPEAIFAAFIVASVVGVLKKGKK